MAFMSSDPGPYITQWLQTATGKNVICQKAMLQDRLMFTCARCGQSLTTTTSAVKTDGTVDYGLQEFVKIHAHKGGHKDATIINTPTGQLKQVVDPNTGEMKLVPIDYELHKGGIPMTADFKKIDLKPEKEQQIKAKIDAYNQMMEKALDDKALAAKIAELQSSDKEKAKENYDKLPAFKPLPMKGGGMIHPFNAGDILNDNSMDSIEPLEMDGNGGPWNPKTDVDAELAKTKAVENILKIKVLQQAIKDQQAKLLGQHQGTTTQTVTPAKKDKVLEQPVGRKFR
jgi:hypothetical protein